MSPAGIQRMRAVQWPILLVGLIFAAAFVLVAAGFWRRGALLIGIAVGTGAALRLALPEHQAGLLVVRNKGIDFVSTATTAAVMLYTASTIDPLGTS